MTTDQKGAIAELAIQLAAVKLGVEVYRPVAEGGRYDLIFDLGEKLWRVETGARTAGLERMSTPAVSFATAHRSAKERMRPP